MSDPNRISVDMQVGFSKLNATMMRMSTSLEGLTNLMTRLADKLAPVKKKLEDTAKAMDVFKNLKPLAKQVNSSKFNKGIKKFGGVVKDLIKGGIRTWAIEKLMMLLQPFLNLLDLFNPIFEVMGAIIQEALMPVMKELIPYIILASQWLMQNKEAIIQVINVLIPVLALFHLLKGNFDQLNGIIVPVTTSVKTLTDGFKWLMDTAIMPVYNFIKDFFIWQFTFLYDKFSMIYDFIKDYFIGQFTFLYDKFSTIYNFLKDNLNVILETFYDWIDDIYGIVDDANDVLEDFVGWIEDLIATANSWNPFSSSSSSSSKKKKKKKDFNILDPGTWFADGGIVEKPTSGIVGEAGKEAVIPLERSNPFIDALEEMAYQQRQATMLLGEIRDTQQKSSGPQRRLFG